MSAPHDTTAAQAVHLPSDPELLLLRARFLCALRMRRARTRARDADAAYQTEFAALNTLTELGFIDPDQLKRWRAECLQRFEAAEATKLCQRVPA